MVKTLHFNARGAGSIVVQGLRSNILCDVTPPKKFYLFILINLFFLFVGG